MGRYMKHPDLVKALEPITSRVRTDICWKKTDDGPRRIDAPLTATKLDKHVNGGPAYGAAPILPGQTTTMVAVLDLDSHKGETSWPDMLVAAQALIDELEAYGMAPLVFRSTGGLGLHVYLLWEQPQDAYSVRVLLRMVLEARGFKPGDGGVAKKEVEIFPKQNSVAEGKFGNMFILPLAGASVPLCPLTLADLAKDDAAAMEWPLSPAVPVVAREIVERPEVIGGDAELERMRSALAAIPNEGDGLPYDQWRDLAFAVHNGAGEAGLALLHEFSARSDKYGPEFLDERVWPYISNDNGAENGAITIGTLWRVAREHGWREPIEEEFEALPALVSEETGAPVEPLPNFVRDKRGAIEAVIENVSAATRRPDLLGARLAYDAFRDDIVIAPPDTDDWHPLRDGDYVRFRIQLARRGFKPVGKEMMRDAVVLVSEDNVIDSAQWWLNKLEWDGVPRIETFLPAFFGAEDTPYARAVSLYMWTALAGRVMEPGCQADMVPILEGDQGLRKTSALVAMTPGPDYFIEVDFEQDETDLARKMRGALLGEIGELHGLHSRAIEAIKKFITRRHEKWTPKYKEFNTTFPRRLLLVGTTNQTEILVDETGNRRWLPIHVERADVEAIVVAREQLWAEARDRFEASGVAWQEAEELAAPAHEAYAAEDAWEAPIAEWLDEDRDEIEGGETGVKWRHGRFKTVEVGLLALRLTASQLTKPTTNRICAILRKLGYMQKTTRLEKGGKPVRCWHAKNS